MGKSLQKFVAGDKVQIDCVDGVGIGEIIKVHLVKLITDTEDDVNDYEVEIQKWLYTWDDPEAVDSIQTVEGVNMISYEQTDHWKAREYEKLMRISDRFEKAFKSLWSIKDE